MIQIAMSVFLLGSAPSPQPADPDCIAPTVAGAIIGGIGLAALGVVSMFALADQADREGRSFAGSSATTLGASIASPFAAMGGLLVGGGAGGLAGYGTCQAISSDASSH
jgi:hypothetical protein